MPAYIYGIHPVEELLAHGLESIERLWVQKGARSQRIQRIVQRARKNSVDLRFEDRSRMDRMVRGEPHQGVIARCGEKKTCSLESLMQIPADTGEDPFFLILDRVEDPGNLGAVVRTAAAAGVHGIILPRRGAAPLGATAFKRSSGALARLPVARVTNLVRAIKLLKDNGIWVVGASAAAGEVYTEADLSGPVALVVGGESGVRRLVEESCDLMVSIPMKKENESLNLSVAAALLIYEVVRNRIKN
jgi:23S rRNA (guanosine2251-2'-O)-methyltransferase